MANKRVLIAEDDPDIASTLARGLKLEGYEPAIAHCGSSAIALVEQSPCSAALVDMMLGEDRGDQLVRTLRSGGMRGPILMLSALASVDDRALGLDSGADDYIAKPFDFSELMARFRVHETLRERTDAVAPVLSFGDLTYDVDTRTAQGIGRKEALTERESDLLRFLMDRANKVVTRGEIYDTLWAKDTGGSENVVDVYLGYLRRKLAPMSDFGIALKTIRSRGFLLTEHEDET
jgi:DNA-binding response OmpR family regulator